MPCRLSVLEDGLAIEIVDLCSYLKGLRSVGRGASFQCRIVRRRRRCLLFRGVFEGLRRWVVCCGPCPWAVGIREGGCLGRLETFRGGFER